MTTQLAGALTFLGLLAIGVGFYLLQRLKVRQRTLVVETTMFWRQALEETRARVLVQRFRHPWVYALLVTIATLLWLAFAQLSSEGDPDDHTLILVDGAATMARGDRFEKTLELVTDLVDEIPSNNRSVVLCGGTPVTVLRPNEHPQLLAERLAGASAQACPATIEQVIQRRVAEGRKGKLQIVVAGDSIVAPAFAQSLPESVTLTRLTPADQAFANAGITGLGVAPASSGSWDRVDVLIELRGVAETGNPTPPQPPTLTLDGAKLATDPAASRTGEGSLTLRYKDLPARGQLLGVQTAATDANAHDNAATIVLPERREQRIAVEAGLPAPLAAVVRADPAMVLEPNPGAADIVVRRAGSSFGGSKPAIELADETAQTHAFLFQCRNDEDPNDVVFRLHDRLGLAEIDATDVARRMGKIIAMGAVQGDTRGLRMWQSLLSPEYNFVQSRSFPLFVALAVRWISGHWEAPLTIPVGEPVELDGAVLTDASGAKRGTLGDAFTPAAAAVFQTDRGQRIATALLDRNVTAPAATEPKLARAEASGFSLGLTTFLMSLALVLILVEWVLFQQGRLP